MFSARSFGDQHLKSDVSVYGNSWCLFRIFYMKPIWIWIWLNDELSEYEFPAVFFIGYWKSHNEWHSKYRFTLRYCYYCYYYRHYCSELTHSVLDGGSRIPSDSIHYQTQFSIPHSVTITDYFEVTKQENLIR